jgi:hypothetical protein
MFGYPLFITLMLGRGAVGHAATNAVTFLASDAASDIVGQVLVVSGGVSP